MSKGVDDAFEAFVKGLKKHYGVISYDEPKLREVFERNLASMVGETIRYEAEDGGAELDELYGDDIFDAVTFKDDEDDEGDEES